MNIFPNILDRLFADQETNRDSPFHGQFARSRDKEARLAVQRDREPLDKKPELYMTFNAVQTLQYLNHIITQPSYKIPYKAILEERKTKIVETLNGAGDFAERLLLQHSNNDNFIMMQEPISYNASDEFISYRHTIGATIILRLLERRPDMEGRILEKLLTNSIQKKDGGWPITDKKHSISDILCSAHAAFLFQLALKCDKYKNLEEALKHKISSTLAFLTLQAEQNDGLWVYEHELGALPFTARTYPEVYKLLVDSNSPLERQIPQSLLKLYHITDRAAYTLENRKKTGICNREQFAVRMAYAFKTASKSMPDQFLEQFAEARHDAILSYSNSGYYETYDLCCLLMMLIDKFELSPKDRVEDAVSILEPIVEELPFIGILYRVSKKIYERLKERGYLPL